PVIELRVRWSEPLPAAMEPFFAKTHTDRPDASSLVVRLASGRAFAREHAIPLQPHRTDERPRGTVTIDNSGYLRYAGEVHLAKTDLPADPRVNVLGRIIPEDIPLLDQLERGVKFKLVQSC